MRCDPSPQPRRAFGRATTICETTMDVARPNPLARIDLFSGLGPAELAAIERHVRIRQVRAGQTLVGYQDDSHDLFFILSGKLKVTIFSEAGREVAFRELQAGQSFGAGVVGGVRVRECIVAIGMGERKCADVECENVGLDICVGASDISIVGMIEESKSSCWRWN